MGVMKEYTDAELLGKVEDLITGGISFYLIYNKKGYTSELKGIDTVKGKECYKVLFSKSGNEVKTNYYDKKTFYFIKSVNPNNTNIELDNYKDVKGIFRPFKLVQSSEVEIEVTEYQFNKPIDTKLLSKPWEQIINNS